MRRPEDATPATPPLPHSATPPLAWSVWLARRQPGRAVAVMGVMLAAGGIAFWVSGNPLLPVLAVGVLVGAVGEFLLPVRYSLSEAGAEARSAVFWRRIDWAQVKRVYVGEDEIKLSPLPQAGRHESFRGVNLRCGGNRDAVLAAVRSFRDAVPRH